MNSVSEVSLYRKKTCQKSFHCHIQRGFLQLLTDPNDFDFIFKAKVLLESYYKIQFSFYPCRFSRRSRFLNTNNPDMSELTSPALIDSKNYDNWQQLLTAWPSSIFCTSASSLADRFWKPQLLLKRQ